jgi:hypothetical protein
VHPALLRRAHGSYAYRFAEADGNRTRLSRVATAATASGSHGGLTTAPASVAARPASDSANARLPDITVGRVGFAAPARAQRRRGVGGLGWR